VYVAASIVQLFSAWGIRSAIHNWHRGAGCTPGTRRPSEHSRNWTAASMSSLPTRSGMRHFRRPGRRGPLVPRRCQRGQSPTRQRACGGGHRLRNVRGRRSSLWPGHRVDAADHRSPGIWRVVWGAECPNRWAEAGRLRRPADYTDAVVVL